MPRRKPYIDTRPDWRDPNMKVHALAYDNYNQKWVWLTLTPEERQAYAQYEMEALSAPHWSHDPTYNLRRKK